MTTAIHGVPPGADAWVQLHGFHHGRSAVDGGSTTVPPLVPITEEAPAPEETGADDDGDAG